MQELTIDQAAEAKLVGEHEIECWEWFAEGVVEQAAAEGVNLTGRHDEIYRHHTLMDYFHLMTTRDPETHCRCEDYRD